MTDPELEIPEFSYRNRRREPAIDPLMRKIALVAGGIATLIILVALIWGGMKPGMGFGPPPVIKPPPGPLRVVPANPGGLTVPGANQQIMSGQNATVPASLAPATPAPDISAFQGPPAPAAPAQGSTAPASASASPPPAAAEPALAPPAAAAPQAAPAAPAQPAAAAKAAAPAAGEVEIQLAATRDPGGVRIVWARLSAKMPDLLAGRTPLYTQTMVDGEKYWRLRLGGFADIAAARQFCGEVEAKGGACTVATF